MLRTSYIMDNSERLNESLKGAHEVLLSGGGRI